MLKWVKIAVVAMFVFIVVIGAIVLFAFNDKMDEYGKLVGIIFPVFLAQVIPALIGRPLTDYVQAKAAATRAKSGATQEETGGGA